MEVLIILILVIINGAFAMSEIAVVSARKARLRQYAERGDQRALAALKLANDPNRFLSTVQVGITLVGILAGAFGGSTLAHTFETQLARIEPFEPYSQALGFAAVVLLTTYLSLVIGELVPKRLALNNAEQIASYVARPMRVLSRVMAPVVSLLTLSTDLILWVLRVQDREEEHPTDEEITVMIKQGAKAGAFEETESHMVAGVLRLDDLQTGMIMTPRTEIVWLNLDDDLEKNLARIAEHPFSNYPVGHGDPDNIAGVIHIKDLTREQIRNQPIDLQALARKPLIVPESHPVSRLLESFKRTGEHVTLVICEYG